MTNLLKEILTLGSFFLAGVLFVYLKGKLLNQVKTTIVNKIDDKTKEELKSLYEKGVITVKEYAKKIGITVKEVETGEKEEVFSWAKFFNGFGGLFNPVGWAKDIVGIFNLRKLTIYILVIGIIFAYGWYKGTQGKAVKIDLGYGKEAKIDLNGEYLYIDKEGNVYLKDTKTDKIIKQISVKDVPGLKKKLAPYGFEFEPIALIGGGLGDTGMEAEGGVGLSWLRYYKWRIQSFITNRGLYPIGLGYRITDNSGLTLGAGKGWAGDNRITLMYHFKF